MHPPASPTLLSRPARKRALIGLTPLIDVVFILLIFFMLASSFLDWRAIRLNAPVSAGTGGSSEGALLVEILPDGLRLAAQTLTMDELAKRISERLTEKPEQRILIRAVDGIPLQRTVDLLDRLKSSGATNMSLMRGKAL